MKKQTKYSRVFLVREIDGRFEIKAIEVTTDFADFLKSEYIELHGKESVSYSCCWFNSMVIKYAAVCGIYRIPKNSKSCD